MTCFAQPCNDLLPASGWTRDILISLLLGTQAAQDARAASKLKDVVDGGVTVLVPSSTTDSFSPAEKKVNSAFL